MVLILKARPEVEAVVVMQALRLFAGKNADRVVGAQRIEDGQQPRVRCGLLKHAPRPASV